MRRRRFPKSSAGRGDAIWTEVAAPLRVKTALAFRSGRVISRRGIARKNVKCEMTSPGALCADGLPGLLLPAQPYRTDTRGMGGAANRASG